MLETATILFFSFGYMALLFTIAYFGDKHAQIGRSIVSNPYIYALSLAIYCTAWTFYGSVGRAVRDGPMFLTIYIGPTLAASLGWIVIRKIIRISKVHHITSIADFIGSRYGKSMSLGGLVTIIAVLGIIPYISLQLKAISTSFLIIKKSAIATSSSMGFAKIPIYEDTAFYVALILSAFAILFGTRHLEATERHEGLVAAIAFESVVKLVAFLAVGVFVTYGMYNGFGDIFAKAGANPQLKKLFVLDPGDGRYMDWAIYIFLSMMAVIFLPRQFQLAVVENVNENHLNRAAWLFPLYLFAVNIFVVPVALAGLMKFSGNGFDPDYFVLTLPKAANREVLAFWAYIGGASAATGMVVVESIALSIMISNHLVMPVLLKLQSSPGQHGGDISRLLLLIRRSGIILVLLLGYFYFKFIGEYYQLVYSGLVSFVAVAQFAPPVLGGLFWKGGTKKGAMWGLVAGFSVWLYTLVLPSFVYTGLLPETFITRGLFGIEILRPYHLFGLYGLDNISHAVFWSLFANTGIYMGISLFLRPSAIEHTQAALFVDVFRTEKSYFWRGTALVPDIKSLLERFLGERRTKEALNNYASANGTVWEDASYADAKMVAYAEKLLAGVIGSASARVVVASVVKEEPLGLEEVMNILDETRQVITYSKELEKATKELKQANERLKELDRLKDEFISTVTHELRTPLTSVRSLAEILYDTPDIDMEHRQQFLKIIIKESERLTRLINQVLDLQKIESGNMEWNMAKLDFDLLIKDSLDSTNQLIIDKNIDVKVDIPHELPKVTGDKDRLIQVMVNLISNAVKFCPDKGGKIEIIVKPEDAGISVSVKDNGIGISPEDIGSVFEKFRQIKDATKGRPAGSGLGLSIARQIIEHHKGKITARSMPGKGSIFSFFLPSENREKTDEAPD